MVMDSSMDWSFSVIQRKEFNLIIKGLILRSESTIPNKFKSKESTLDTQVALKGTGIKAQPLSEIEIALLNDPAT